MPIQLAKRLYRALTAAFVLLTGLAAGPVFAQTASIDIGGRSISLACLGSGPQTVLLEAGGSDWSDVWALVQPQLGRDFRVCAYDRAGLGRSDPAPLPRSPAAIAADLHALIAAAGLQRPLILVGHSLGGFTAKLHAALYPGDVAGLVLLDPAEHDTDARIRPLLVRQLGQREAARSELEGQVRLAWLLDRYRHCAAEAAKGPLDPASDTYRRCTDPVRAALGPERAAERVRIQTQPAYQLAQASEILGSVYGSAEGNAVYDMLFQPGALGRLPLAVLTSSPADPADPAEAADHAAMVMLHRQTARLSRRGWQQTVAGSSHYLQLDQPATVIATIRRVAAVAQRGRP